MYDFKRTESEVLGFWHKNSIFSKSMEARKRAKSFVFFEGPPTANGRPGIHHFLGRAFKDLFCRYKSMQGFFVLRKAGWDTHGLPVEIEIEKQLGFKTKKDIEDYGIAKFNKKAKESVWKYKTEWEEMTKKMGFWVDLDDPYITYENSYIESLWNIIGQIWDKKLLYLAHKVVPFCVRCGTPLSSHEVAQGYRKVKERSVYIKFKVKNPKAHHLPVNTYVIAWTTTPWTLPGNVALAVGANIDYIVAKKYSEHFIIAKDLAIKVLGEGYEINKELKGGELVGLEYEPLFDVNELKTKTSYKVYEADFVSTEDGTGVVHTAVMYGEDDYNLGTKLGLPKVHTVTEAGSFVGVSKDLDGLYVKSAETEKIIIEHLDKNNLLFKSEDYEHDYPFCWRCDSPLLYYAKSSWFIKMTQLRDQLIKNNSKVNWIPDHIKDGRFGQWLSEVKDWAFSRERYWGTPLPIWKCQKCDSLKVINSVAEMEKNAVVQSAKRNTYYTLRHGHTTRDEEGKMLISTDINHDKYHLTAEGQRELQKVAGLIKNNHKIDLIYASPFIRTMEAAEIVGKLIHTSVTKDDRLREIGHGGCEGKSIQECMTEINRKSVNDKPHELGESWNEARARMFDFIQEMEAKYSGKSILIVSHGDPIWLLNCDAQGATAKEVEDSGRKGGRFEYPELAGFSKLDWRLVPRNEHGEMDLHRPYIDNVYLRCSECGASMKKIPDLIDVWFDSGAMPYAQWHYPFENKKMYEQQFPADFIVEGIDQTRGWFYTLLAISTLLGKGNPYKNVMSLGHALDDKGKKMSKSKGNVVSPFEVMDKVGADAARWYFYTVNSPGDYKLFSMKDVEGKLKGFIFTLQNCIRFYELYGDGVKGSFKSEHLLDKWLLSKYNQLIVEVTSSLDIYDPMNATRLIERFVIEDLSNWWLRRSRKRKEAFGLLRLILTELSKLLAPFTPFMAEDIYRQMNKGKKQPSLSVHMENWPEADKKQINEKLEEEMDEIRKTVTAGLALRKEKQIKVRQPLRTLSVARSSKFSNDLEALIREELNVKNVVYAKGQEQPVIFDMELDQALINEGYARELIRQIQDMRKEAKYKIDEEVSVQWHSDDSAVSTALHEWAGEIKKEALLDKFISGPSSKKVYDVEKEFELATGRKIWLGIIR